VARGADETPVDVMLRAGGIEYAEASREAQTVTLRGVPMPCAFAPRRLRRKRTFRDQDEPDRPFREAKLRARGA
jgi:hypothetical protein